MKKLLITFLLVVGVATFAFAQKVDVKNKPCPVHTQIDCCCCCSPCDMHKHGPKGKSDLKKDVEATVKSEKEAKAKVEEYIKSNFKGYKVGKAEKIEGRRGDAYSVEITDAAGNKGVFHVNPWGKVVGPIFVK